VKQSDSLIEIAYPRVRFPVAIARDDDILATREILHPFRAHTKCALRQAQDKLFEQIDGYYGFVRKSLIPEKPLDMINMIIIIKNIRLQTI